MFSCGQDTYSDVYKRLTSKATELHTKIAISNENSVKLKKCEENIRITSLAVNMMLTSLQELNKLSIAIQNYLTERRKKGNMAVNTAIMSAHNVVPDSMEGVRFVMSGEEAWLESEDGMLVERMEGGGFRATCSLFMRRVALTAAKNTMQILILDELLAKLSPESSAIVSTYLPVLAQNMQIIIVEQKKEVYSRINCDAYNFLLTDNSTIVRKEVISNGEDPDAS